jgi:hypothetical protein
VWCIFYILDLSVEDQDEAAIEDEESKQEQLFLEDTLHTILHREIQNVEYAPHLKHMEKQTACMTTTFTLIPVDAPDM